MNVDGTMLPSAPVVYVSPGAASSRMRGEHVRRVQAVQVAGDRPGRQPVVPVHPDLGIPDLGTGRGRRRRRPRPQHQIPAGCRQRLRPDRVVDRQRVRREPGRQINTGAPVDRGRLDTDRPGLGAPVHDLRDSPAGRGLIRELRAVRRRQGFGGQIPAQPTVADRRLDPGGALPGDSGRGTSFQLGFPPGRRVAVDEHFGEGRVVLEGRAVADRPRADPVRVTMRTRKLRDPAVPRRFAAGPVHGHPVEQLQRRLEVDADEELQAAGRETARHRRCEAEPGRHVLGPDLVGSEPSDPAVRVGDADRESAVRSALRRRRRHPAEREPVRFGSVDAAAITGHGD